MGSHIFGFFGVRQFFIFTVSKRTRMFVVQIKSEVFFIQSEKWVEAARPNSNEHEQNFDLTQT